MGFIYHVTTEDAWAEAQERGEYRGSTLGLSLDDVGFVHCSFENQVARIVHAFYRGVPRVVVLAIDLDRLHSPVRYESPEGGEEKFPHVYGPIGCDAVVEAKPIDSHQ